MNLLKLPDFRVRQDYPLENKPVLPKDAVVLKRKLVYAIESGAGFELS